VLNKAGENELVVIGGSAGSLPILLRIIKQLPADFSVPIVIVVHRQRNVLSEFTTILTSAFKNRKIVEPDDKISIDKGSIYVAPQNYHLLVEKDFTFSLDYSEPVKFSRPSIDVTFESAASVYKSNLIAILLSGANNDGAAGLVSVVQNGGSIIAQDPETAEFPAMPASAIASASGIVILTPDEIAAYLTNIDKK
jgi:two-component system chemotaxis response regulator CheB